MMIIVVGNIASNALLDLRNDSLRRSIGKKTYVWGKVWKSANWGGGGVGGVTIRIRVANALLSSSKKIALRGSLFEKAAALNLSTCSPFLPSESVLTVSTVVG